MPSGVLFRGGDSPVGHPVQLIELAEGTLHGVREAGDVERSPWGSRASVIPSEYTHGEFSCE